MCEIVIIKAMKTKTKVMRGDCSEGLYDIVHRHNATIKGEFVVVKRDDNCLCLFHFKESLFGEGSFETVTLYNPKAIQALIDVFKEAPQNVA